MSTAKTETILVLPDGTTRLPEIMMKDLGIEGKGGYVWFLRGKHRWEAFLESELEAILQDKSGFCRVCDRVTRNTMDLSDHPPLTSCELVCDFCEAACTVTETRDGLAQTILARLAKGTP